MRIGLTYTGSPEKHANYANWLRGDRADIEVIRLSAGDDNFEAIRTCDGLVLSGGVDIDPSLYGGAEAYEKMPPKGWEKDRDLFEQSVLQYSLDHGIPVLGVCRGLQLINITLQGTLIQDLGVEGDEMHQNIGLTDRRHPIRVKEGTLLKSIVREEGGEVNSAHHQAILQLGKGLVVNCSAEDGTIEGIEWADPVSGRAFLLGVQWHPERMYTNRFADTPLYGKIRDRYLEEIEKSKIVK